MNLASFLIAMVGPLTARILASLGLSLVTMTGLTVALTTFQTTVQSNVNSLPAEALAIGGLLGIWQSLGMLLGAVTFCATWASTSGFWRLVKA